MGACRAIEHGINVAACPGKIVVDSRGFSSANGCSPIIWIRLRGMRAIHEAGCSQQLEDLWDDRGFPVSANRRLASLYLPGRHRAQAQLGWRGPQRVKSDGYREILGM
jgi:hypothetical protein